MFRIIQASIVAVASAVMLVSCGGGGSSGDSKPGDTVTENVTGPNSFLLFPNSLVLADGRQESNTAEYATAYYEAIDPNNERDTLFKWMTKNGFGTAAGPLGEVHVTFGDIRDLGYGREMHARQNPDGTFAFYVRNYLVTAGSGYGYSSLNLDAAVAEDLRWHIGTNAIEFSPGPDVGDTASFAKFYNFDTGTGARRLTANLDGRGNKAMPGICINCHGGRADPLTPPNALGKQLFALVQNSVSLQRGDTQSRLQMFDVNAFQFSTQSGYRRTDLEAALKTLNRMILCSYPVSGVAPANRDPACVRPTAGTNEWQGDAAEVILAAYGGYDGTDLTNNTFSTTTYVDTTRWPVAGGRDQLFKNVAEPACMTCHRLRGTANQDDISFIDYAKFEGYSDRIKAHVYDRGNMPLAKIVSDNFWSSIMPETLASWLESLGLGYNLRQNGALVEPGRPIADPGPDRVVRHGATTLSAANSLFANRYSWAFVSNPGNATLINATSSAPTFTATVDGTYELRLVVSKDGVQSSPASLKIRVNNSLPYDPTTLRFVADIKPVLQNLCVSCHTGAAVAGRPPILYTNLDRNDDGLVNATDDAWFYKELRGRINFTDVSASPLLRKPSGQHHSGGLLAGFNTGVPVGDAGREDYDKFANWIMNGAPE